MRGRLLCRIGLHKWTAPRGDGYARSVCKRCGEPWARPGDAVAYPVEACPTCPHPRDAHGPFGCSNLYCGCSRVWIGGGWP